MSEHRGLAGRRVRVTLARGATIEGTLHSVTRRTAWLLVDHDEGMVDEFVPLDTVTSIDPSS